MFNYNHCLCTVKQTDIISVILFYKRLTTVTIRLAFDRNSENRAFLLQIINGRFVLRGVKCTYLALINSSPDCTVQSSLLVFFIKSDPDWRNCIKSIVPGKDGQQEVDHDYTKIVSYRWLVHIDYSLQQKRENSNGCRHIHRFQPGGNISNPALFLGQKGFFYERQSH